METVCKATLERTLPPDVQEDAIHNKACIVCLSAAAVYTWDLETVMQHRETYRQTVRVWMLKRAELWWQCKGWRRRGEGRQRRQWRQQRWLVIDIRDLALPPDPAASSSTEPTELTQPRWRCTALHLMNLTKCVARNWHTLWWDMWTQAMQTSSQAQQEIWMMHTAGVCSTCSCYQAERRI